MSAEPRTLSHGADAALFAALERWRPKHEAMVAAWALAEASAESDPDDIAGERARRLQAEASRALDEAYALQINTVSGLVALMAAMKAAEATCESWMTDEELDPAYAGPDARAMQKVFQAASRFHRVA